jgi:lipoprotein-releasing system ATP-binding protein
MGGTQPLEVLHGVDLRVRGGEFVAVVGQSGSGKSTLLNLLGALDRPTSGTVIIDGHPLQTLSDNELADLRNRSIGFIFQFHYLLEEYSCLENALLPILIRTGTATPAEEARVRELLARVELTHRLHAHPSTLSGGEQQRTAVIRALANQPRLVLADEPTGNLDSISGRQVFTLMRDMNRTLGTAFVMVTHDERLAAEADRVTRITDGLLTEE